MGTRTTGLVLVGLVAVLTVAAGSALAQGELEVSDPDDDGQIRRVSEVGCTGTGAACSQAPPELEIVGVELRETPRDLVARLELEALPEDLGALAEENDPTDPSEMDPGKHETFYLVCWGRQGAEDPCRTQVHLTARWAHGEIHTWAGSTVLEAGCADEIPCQYGLPVEIETGEPGAIEWRFPRELLPNATQGAEVSTPLGVSARVDTPSEPVGVHGGWEGLGFELSQTYRFGYGRGYAVDAAFEQASMTLEQPAEERLPDALTSNHIRDPPRDIAESDRSDLDVLDVAFRADREKLQVSVEKALVREDPRDQTVFVNFGFDETIPFIQVVESVSEGEREFFAHRWSDFPDGEVTDLTVEGNVTPGEPGWVNFTVPLSEAPIRGWRLNWSWAGASDWTEGNETEPLAEVTPGVRARTERFDWDIVGPGPAYTVGSTLNNSTLSETVGDGPTTGLANSTFVAQDGPDDADYPSTSGTLAQAGSTAPTRSSQPGPENFEITRVQAKATDEDTVWLTLDIEELSRVRVPADWDAVLYAGSVQTSEGTFLAGLYKTDGGPNQPAEEVWLCARDTAVLTDGADEIPPRASWVQIDGVLDPSRATQGDDGNQSAGSSSATIRAEVPRDCLVGSPSGPLDVGALGAGTYLVRHNEQRPAEVHAVDEAARSDNRTLEPTTLSSTSTTPAAAAPSETGWVTQPFGVDNFWDIAGIAGTVLASAVGALLVRRRRSALKDYLERIDEINEAYAKDPSGRQTALQDLQAEAKDDLVDGRLTENQYVVVKDRIAEEVSEARAEGIEEAFGELPHNLLRKLQGMVSDGALSPEDRRLFSTMLEDGGLNEEAKARLRRKLDVWTEDASG